MHIPQFIFRMYTLRRKTEAVSFQTAVLSILYDRLWVDLTEAEAEKVRKR